MSDLLDANATHFAITIDGVGSPIRVLQFWGEERMSHLFTFSLQIESDDFEIAPISPIGKNVWFTINFLGHERQIDGIVSLFEFAGLQRDVALYNLQFVPSVFLLSQIHQCRIFQDKTPVAILQEVLDKAGLAGSGVKFKCSASYKPLEYCVQYRESDWDFFNRIAERFGIFYFFESSSAGTTMIVADSSSVHPDISSSVEILYAAPGDLTNDEDFIHEFKLNHQLRPGKQTVRDYNFKSPQLDLTSKSKETDPKKLEWYDYPGRFEDQDGGTRVAQIRHEVDNCVRSQGSGLSNSVRLFPGSIFELTNHPAMACNSKYLLTAITHSGSQPSPDNLHGADLGYSNDFHFQKSSIPFRADFRTRKPVVEGQQTATVTGPSGEEIYCDEFGRIKVRFHWDRSGSPDDNSSCWMRTTQTWAGKGWGGVYVPRIGQEVLVAFLEGDPDLPIVVGCVYNGLNKPPYPLPSKRTVSTLKSNSSLGGDGYNEIRFEDLKSSEEFYLQAEKDLKILTKHDKNQSTGNNESLEIGKNRTKSVGADEQVSVGGNRSESVEKDESISVGKNRTVSVGADESISVDKNQTISVGKKLSQSVGDDADLQYGKNLTEQTAKKQSVSVGEDLVVDVGKKHGLKVGDKMTVQVDNEIAFKCGSAEIILKKNGDITIKGGKISIKGSGDVSIKGSKITQN
jgi:type VI secretion system secreted protein VgrG